MVGKFNKASLENIKIEFNQVYNQEVVSGKPDVKNYKKFMNKPDNRPTRKKRTPYEMFLLKYDAIEKNGVEHFKTDDLIYYFKKVATDNNKYFAITSLVKERAIMKRVMSNFDNEDICLMIEFLFNSPQDYLDKDRLNPSLLASAWVNTIIVDSKLWLEDKFVPRKNKSSKANPYNVGLVTNEDSDNDDVEVWE